MDQETAKNLLSGGASLAVLMGIAALALIVGLIIGAVIAYFIWKPYTKLPAEFQSLPPWVIWLTLIPIVNLVVVILVVIMLPLAFEQYFKAQSDTSNGDCGKILGYCYLGSIVLAFIPCIGAIFALAGLVCLILFIIKLHAMAAKIPQQ